MKKLNDYTVLFLALGAAFVFVYFIPVMVNRILFFIFIYLFYKSERDYIWLAFLLILIEVPGQLFSGALRDEEMRLPIYTLAPGYSITFLQIFIITALFKALRKKILYNPIPFLKTNLAILLIYFIFLILIGIIIGFSHEVGVYLYNVIINLSLFYSVFYLFHREIDYVNFFKMIIPFGFIAFGLQFYQLSFGEPLEKYFKSYTHTFDSSDVNEINIRPIESIIILTLLFFFSIYFLLNKKKYFNKILLIGINVVSFLSIFITGTRSYVMMSLMFYLLSFIFISVKFSNMILKYSLAGVFVIIIIFSSDLFVNQFNSAFLRVSTLELVAEGDITGGGSILRYDVRAPALMKSFFEESTIIFGTGYSETYLKRNDMHVGFHNLLFNTGIVGVFLFAVFIGSVILNTIWINRKLYVNNPYKDILKIFPISIISIMFVNSGTQFIGYDVSLSRIFLLVFILYFLNNQLSCAMQWEEENSH